MNLIYNKNYLKNMKNVKPFNKFINEEIGDPNWLDKQPVGGSLPTEE